MEFTYYDFLKGHMSSEGGVIVHNLRLLEKLDVVKKLLWLTHKINVDFELISKTTSSNPYEYSHQILLHEDFQPIITIPSNNPIKMWEASKLLRNYLRYVSVSVRNLNEGMTASTSFFYNDDFIVPYRIKDITNETLIAARQSALQLELHNFDLPISMKEEKKKWYQFW